MRQEAWLCCAGGSWPTSGKASAPLLEGPVMEFRQLAATVRRERRTWSTGLTPSGGPARRRGGWRWTWGESVVLRAWLSSGGECPSARITRCWRPAGTVSSMRWRPAGQSWRAPRGTTLGAGWLGGSWRLARSGYSSGKAVWTPGTWASGLVSGRSR